MRCSGEPVENSPFLIRVGDPDNKIRVAHVQNEAAQAEKVIKSEVDLALETPFQIDERDVSATVLGPGDEKVASQLDKDREGKYHVKFLPNKPGQYKIYVRYGGELVEGAPYIVNVNDKVNNDIDNNNNNNNNNNSISSNFFKTTNFVLRHKCISFIIFIILICAIIIIITIIINIYF